jgi:hypothetical protein
LIIDAARRSLVNEKSLPHESLMLPPQPGQSETSAPLIVHRAVTAASDNCRESARGFRLQPWNTPADPESGGNDKKMPK